LSDTATGESTPDDPRPSNIGSLDLALVAARSADEKQGRNIVVLDVGPVLHITEYFVVIDAPNRRLVRTLVDDIEQSVRAVSGRSPLRTEGLKEHQWVLVDYGDVVVHVFLDEVRRFYEIERLYRDVASIAWADHGGPSSGNHEVD
jgi:ribosome-associated protein